MKFIYLLIRLLFFAILAGCLPDSITKFDEDPPSDPYAVPPSYTTDIPTGITYDKNGPHKLKRFIASQSNQNDEENAEDLSFSLKLYSTSSTKPFTEESEMTFSISSNSGSSLPTGLTFNTKTGEVSGQPTSFLKLTTFTVLGTHASGQTFNTSFEMSVTTKIDTLTYKQKVGKKILLELSSIVNIDNKYYLYNDDGLFSSYHPINDSDYKTIINQNGYKADVSSGSIDDVYNTVVAVVQGEDALFKAGDFIDIGSNYFGKKNKIEKVIHFYNNSDSTLDLSPLLDPSLLVDNTTDETVDYSVNPPLTTSNYGVNFNPANGEASKDSTPDFLPTQFSFTVRNQNGETQSTSIWITFFNSSPKVVNTLNYNISKDDVFKITLENSSNFKEGGSLSTSKLGTKATIISKKFETIQLKVTESTTDSSFEMGTEVDNSSDYIWPETKISTSQRIFSVDSSIDIYPDNSSDLSGFSISPSLPSSLTWDATSGRIYGIPTSTIKDANFTIKAKNLLGKEISTTLALSIIDPPIGLSYSRDAIITISENDATIDKKDHIVSSGGAKGIVKSKVISTLSKSFLLVKVLEGEFKENEQLDNDYNYNKPVATISSVEYYNAAFQLDSPLDNTADGSLILNGHDESTADHIAEIVHVDPTTDKAGVYVRIVKGNFAGNSSYSLNDTNKTSITITDITSDNLIIGIPSNAISSYFTGAYVTVGSTSDGAHKASGVVNYSQDSSISINILNGDMTTDHFIVRDITFENTTDAHNITSINTDHIYNAYVGESFRLVPTLNKGNDTTLTYSIEPELPSGLSMNTSTGIIDGIPVNGIDRTKFTVTTYNDSGDTTHDFHLKVNEQFKLKINFSNSSLSNAILHKEGQGHNRTDCRVTLDQMNNDPSTDTKDILCYVDIGESDLQQNGLSFKLESSGLCPFVEHLPFGFFKKKYTPSSNTPIYQAVGNYTDDTCKQLYNNGIDIPEYSTNSGTGDSTGDFGTSYTSWSEACINDCDDGKIRITRVSYQKSADQKCFEDKDKDGFYDLQNGNIDEIATDATTDSLCTAKSTGSTTYSWNYVCEIATLDANDATYDQTCTGQKIKCMSGPLSKLTELTSEDINNRLGVVSATNSSLTFNYDAPANISDADLSSDLNIYLANFTKNNQCKKVLENGSSSNYIYNDASWDTITKESLASDATAGKFNESNPFYTYNCLSNTGEIKARIRLLVREWNRPFTSNSFIDLIDPDSTLADNNMDSTDDIDGSYIGTTWNQFHDFDDSSAGYDSGPANSDCTPDALTKYKL